MSKFSSSGAVRVDEVVGPGPADGASSGGTTLLPLYFLLGCFFGIVLIKSEVVSWMRIQEMFRFQSFHMYGIMGSAVAVAAFSTALLKRFGVRTMTGGTIAVPAKTLGRGYRFWIGGSLFGVGWALTGSCPGPMVALTGSGIGVYAVAALSALVGAWVYAYLRPRLPHY